MVRLVKREVLPGPDTSIVTQDGLHPGQATP